MLKVLIVDDEPAHRAGLVRHVQWNELGYDMPDQAEDAEEALFLTNKTRFDVFIVDVCMPGMDGIELVRQLRVKYKNIHILIISGYEEFEFARGAVEAGAQAYLLKPLRIEEVERWLKTFARQIKLHEQIAEADRQMQQRLNSSIEIAREKYIKELLNEMEFFGEDAANQLDLLGLPDKDFTYRIVIFSSDEYLTIIKKDPKQGSMVTSRIMNVAKNCITELGESILVENRPDQIVAFLIHKETNKKIGENDLDFCLKRIQELLKTENGISVTICISNLGSSWEETFKLYKEALYILNNGRMLENGQIIWANCYNGVENRDILNLDQLQLNISDCLNILDNEGALRLLGIAMDELERKNSCSLIYMQAFAMGIIGAITRTAELLGMQNVKYTDLCQQMLISTTFNDIRNKLTEMLLSFSKTVADFKSRQKSKIVELVAGYIREHIDEDITVKKLADVAHLNQSYLSVLFKKEMGETISDYTGSIRIETAKELLRNNEIKIYEIADRVGYQTASYFTHQFKKAVGCTPAEFRDRRL